MMPDQNLTNILSVFSFGILKVAIMIVIVMYIVFAAVIVRQEQLMSKVIVIPTYPILKYAALIHLLAAIILLFLALILL